MTFQPLKSFFLTADELLQQDLPTLGKILLVHLNSYRELNTVYQQAGLNRQYFRAMLENRNVGLGTLPAEPEYRDRQLEVTKRMMEAWNWLEREGLLTHNDEQVADWFIISSEGEKYVKQGMIQKSSIPNPATNSTTSRGAPRAFLSYSWDGPVHQQWVTAFAERLQGESGIEVFFDQWHLQPGGDKLHFMEQRVSEADFVIIVCTPSYAERANKRSGGVGYESMIITAELAEQITTTKFIPVLRNGTWESAMPMYLKSKWGLNLAGDPYDEQEYVKLLRAIHKEPVQPPPIGNKPDFSGKSKVKEEPPLPSTRSDLARVFIRTRPGERSGDVRTVRVSVVIENVSTKRKITDYVCTISVPRACLTHTSAIFWGEIRQESPSERRIFRVSSSDPGRPAIIFQGDKVPLFALDLGVDQLKMTGTYLAGDFEGTLAESVVVDAVVEDELLHAERTVADIFANPQQG
jgi:hypothetical protein